MPAVGARPAAPATPAAPAYKPAQFQVSGQGSGAAGPAVGGYNNAMQALMQSLNASGHTTNGQMMELGDQLHQQQGQLQQNLVNKGLGNTTVAQTMQQAPMATYNQGVANVQNQGALRQMGAYNNLANMSAQGGMGISSQLQPYAQAQASQQMAQQMQQMMRQMQMQQQGSAPMQMSGGGGGQPQINNGQPLGQGGYFSMGGGGSPTNSQLQSNLNSGMYDQLLGLNG